MKQNKPNTLDEAIAYIIKLITDQNELNRFNESEYDFSVELHHTLGRWIRNTWGLWGKKGDLYKYLVSIGLEDPDDMSDILIKSAYRIYHKQDIKLKEQVEFYIDYWKNEK